MHTIAGEVAVMDSRIKIKRVIKELGSTDDMDSYFASGDKNDQSNFTAHSLNKENQPPQPLLTVRPQKYYEIGMRINIKQCKSFPDPFLTDFESLGKQNFKSEPKSPLNSKNTRKVRSGKLNALKRRRNSASSDSSQSSTSSSGTCSSQEDRLETAEEPPERARSRASNISNRKRLRIRDEIGNNKHRIMKIQGLNVFLKCKHKIREFFVPMIRLLETCVI